MTHIPVTISPAGGTKVFEWNRTDASQFSSTPDYSDGGGSASTLSVVAASERGNVLRISGAGTSMSAIWLADDEIDFPDERRDLHFEIELANMVYSAGAMFGVSFCAEKVVKFSGLQHLIFGSNEWASRVDADSRVTVGSTGTSISSGTGQGAIGSLLVRGRKPSGDPPEMTSMPAGWGATGWRDCDGRRSGSNRYVFNPYGNNTVLPTDWDSLDCKGWGLAIQSSGGNAAPTTVDILDLRVYRV
jgi:hypothetical protein